MGDPLLEWDFDFHNDLNGGLLTIEISKSLNPRTVLNIGFSSTISNYTRDVLWEQKYEVDMLTTF